MCAINDSVAVILDPTINGTAGDTLDSTLGTWYTTFPYGTIYGISSCVDTNWGKQQGGYVDTLTDINGNRIYGNEQIGGYCWCKLTHPVISRWVFNRAAGGVTYCRSGGCAATCANTYGAQTKETFRVGLFGSVQQ